MAVARKSVTNIVIIFKLIINMMDLEKYELVRRKLDPSYTNKGEHGGFKIYWTSGQ